MMTQKPRGRMPLPKASATKVAAGGSAGKGTPTTAGTGASVIDAISDTTQQNKASAPARDVLAAKGVREAVAQVTPAAGQLALNGAEAVSETLAAISATEEMVKPIAAIQPITAIKSTDPNSTLGMKTMIKGTDYLVAFGQANVDAFAKSGQIWAAGIQELAKLFAATTKASVDESVSAFKAITSAKSITEAINLQSAFVNSAVAKALAGSNKLVDASIKLTEQTLAPVTARVTDAVGTFGTAA